jgi:hypothetical protein
MIRNLDVVQVRHQEVRVASDPDLGQVYDGDIAAVAVHNTRHHLATSKKMRHCSCSGFTLGLSGMLSP